MNAPLSRHSFVWIVDRNFSEAQVPTYTGEMTSHDLTPEYLTTRLEHGPSPIVTKVGAKSMYSSDDGAYAYAVFVRNQSPNITATFTKRYPELAAAGWNNIVMSDRPDRDATLICLQFS